MNVTLGIEKYKKPINRMGYFNRMVCLFGAIGLVFYVASAATIDLRWLTSLILLTYLVLWPIYTSQRLRDMGRSPWLSLLVLIPLVGFIVGIWCLVAKSKAEQQQERAQEPLATPLEMVATPPAAPAKKSRFTNLRRIGISIAAVLILAALLMMFWVLDHADNDKIVLHVTKTSHVVVNGDNTFLVEGHTAKTNYRFSCIEYHREGDAPCFHVTAGEEYHLKPQCCATSTTALYLDVAEQPGDSQVFTIQEETAREIRK